MLLLILMTTTVTADSTLTAPTLTRRWWTLYRKLCYLAVKYFYQNNWNEKKKKKLRRNRLIDSIRFESRMWKNLWSAMKGVSSAPGDYIYFKSQVPLHKIPVSFFFFFLSLWLVMVNFDSTFDSAIYIRFRKNMFIFDYFVLVLICWS